MSIELKNIEFKYDDRFIFQNLSFNFNKNINVVMGKSGSGKTTLINLILKLNKLNSGKIYIDSKDIEILNTQNILKNVFYLPSEGNCIENLSVKKNLLLCENEEIRDDLINFFKIKNNFNASIANLSKGEQKIISLIKTFSTRKKYILIDEPISNLDENNTEIFFKLLKKYSNSHIFIIFIHNLNRYLNKNNINILYLDKKENEHENY